MHFSGFRRRGPLFKGQKIDFREDNFVPEEPVFAEKDLRKISRINLVYIKL